MKRYRLPESVDPDHTTKRSIRRTDYNLKDCLWAIMCPLTMALLILAVLMLGGCAKTVYIPVESKAVSTDSLIHLMRQMLIRQQSVRDTEHINTSERITETFVLNEKGDTIGHDRDREAVTDRTKELEATISEHKAVIDSLNAVKRDSIEVPKPYPVEVTREVEKPLYWWQSALMWVGVVSLIGICIAVWWLVRRKK